MRDGEGRVERLRNILKLVSSKAELPEIQQLINEGYVIGRHVAMRETILLQLVLPTQLKVTPAIIESVIEVKLSNNPEVIRKLTEEEGWVVKERYRGLAQLVKYKEIT